VRKLSIICGGYSKVPPYGQGCFIKITDPTVCPRGVNNLDKYGNKNQKEQKKSHRMI